MIIKNRELPDKKYIASFLWTSFTKINNFGGQVFIRVKIIYRKGLQFSIKIL